MPGFYLNLYFAMTRSVFFLIVRGTKAKFKFFS